MKTLNLLILSVIFSALTPAAQAQELSNQNLICTNTAATVEGLRQVQVHLYSDEKIKISFTYGGFAILNFTKTVSPRGITYNQYKGKVVGLDFKTATAYLTPEHDRLLLPRSDQHDLTYMNYQCAVTEF